MSQEKIDPNASAVPAAGHGKMPTWLFWAWVIFLAWGMFYTVKYALPNLKEWSAKPLPTEAERAK